MDRIITDNLVITLTSPDAYQFNGGIIKHLEVSGNGQLRFRNGHQRICIVQVGSLVGIRVAVEMRNQQAIAMLAIELPASRAKFMICILPRVIHDIHLNQVIFTAAVIVQRVISINTGITQLHMTGTGNVPGHRDNVKVPAISTIDFQHCTGTGVIAVAIEHGDGVLTIVCRQFELTIECFNLDLIGTRTRANIGQAGDGAVHGQAVHAGPQVNGHVLQVEETDRPAQPKTTELRVRQVADLFRRCPAVIQCQRVSITIPIDIQYTSNT